MASTPVTVHAFRNSVGILASANWERVGDYYGLCTREDYPVLIKGIFSTWRHIRQTVGLRYRLRYFAYSLIRPMRVFRYPAINRRILSLPVYARYGDPIIRNDPFRHLSHAQYLRKELTPEQRATYAYQHYSFESQEWKPDYYGAIYSGNGIELWHKDFESTFLNIVLCRPSAKFNIVPEGDLEVILSAGGELLHRMTFSWLVSDSDNLPTIFVGRSQGIPRAASESSPISALGFRQISTPFFCFAALQGLATVVGANEVYGVRSLQQVTANTDSEGRFQVAYDRLWRSLGGFDEGGIGIRMTLPISSKLSHTPKESRKLMAQWADIEASTVSVLRPLRN